MTELTSGAPERKPDYESLVRCVVPRAHSELLRMPLGGIRVFLLRYGGKQEIHYLGGRMRYASSEIPQNRNLVTIGKQLQVILMRGGSHSAVELKLKGKKPKHEMLAGEYYALRTKIRVKVPHASKESPANQISLIEAVVLAHPPTGDMFAWFVE